MKPRRVQALADLSRASYEAIAEEFAITRRKSVWPEMERASAFILPGQSVLDLGCGSGRFLRVLGQKEIRYLGIDNSPKMIEVARREHPEASFNVAEASDLGEAVPQSSFDWAVAFAMWHHLPGRERQVRALDEIARCLKPGGRAIFTVWRLSRYHRLRYQLLRERFKKITRFDFSGWNDFVFPWKDSQGKASSLRYYHSFTTREIRRRFAASSLHLEKLEISAGNCWLEARRR